MSMLNHIIDEIKEITQEEIEKMTPKLNITGMLICYAAWDELDKYYESLKKLPIPELI